MQALADRVARRAAPITGKAAVLLVGGALLAMTAKIEVYLHQNLQP